jgi:molecular chaperone GrpE
MSQADPVNPSPANPEPAAAAQPAPEAAGAAAGGASAASAAPATGPSPEELVAAAKKEAAENYERYLRSVADLENYRKRAVRDREDAAHRAATRILEDLIPVLDNLGHALAATKAANADVKTLAGGVEMIASQLKGALASHGLAEVAPQGKPFDPNLHEAIAQQPSPEVQADHVAAVTRVGYTLNGRLVRAASVVVSTGAPEKPADPVAGVVV